MNTTCIYGLFDPRDGRLRYIGKSNEPYQRLRMHMNDKRRCHRTSWIKNMKASGVRPMVAIIDRVPADGWEDHERRWIATFRSMGYDLVNSTDGGEQPPNQRGAKRSDEMRRKMSIIGKNRTYSEETRRKIAEANLGKKQSEETRRKMSLAMTGRERSEEHRRKLSEALSGRKLSEEQRRKIGGAHRGLKRSEEAKQKTALALKGNQNAKGKKHSEETKRKIGLANTGQKRNEEQRKNISDALIGRVHHSEETRQKMSASHLGVKLDDEHRRRISEGHTGLKRTEEAKIKMREASRRTRRAKEIIRDVMSGLEVFLTAAKEGVHDE